MLANLNSIVIKQAAILAHTLGGGPPCMCRHAKHSREHKHGNACVHPHPCTSSMGLKTHKRTHTVHMYSACRPTNRLAKHKCTHSHWH